MSKPTETQVAAAMTGQFIPRTSAPDPNDKWWINADYGGYNSCILISGKSCLPNCFTGDTEFITSSGIKQFKDCVGQSVEVYTIDGWKSATVEYFGRQEIVEIDVEGVHYSTTWTHRWPVFNSRDDSYIFLHTSDIMPGMMLKHIYGGTYYSKVNSVRRLNIYKKVYCVVEPKTHTFTLGGGHLTGNCVGYAWGRFGEIMNERPLLWRGNAGEWFSHTEDGYERGQDPYPGAVMCFAKEGAAGHVAIVEEVHNEDPKNPYIITSDSAYGGSRWWLSTRRPDANGVYNNGAYRLQGFIYNPNVAGANGMGAIYKTRLDVFLESAQNHLNEDNSWVCEVTGITSNQAWSAAFVVACAKQASSLLNVIIPNTYSCGAIGRIGRLREMGEWFRGPALGEQIEPEVGDILLFRKGKYSIPVNEYYADGCGIVTEYSGNIVTVIQGDSGGHIIQMSYIVSSTIISGCFRPDWSRVDVQAKVPPSYNRIQGLYTDAVSKKDAAVREVGYLDSHYQPSINPSKVKLSMLNYTGLLGDLYSVFGGALTASDASKTSDESDFVPSLMPGGLLGGGEISVSGDKAAVIQTCYSFLTSKGLNSAAACGVLGNIQYESGFNTAAVGDNGTSFGLCQWHNQRGVNMKAYAGDNWATNVTGQMGYLWYELENKYQGVLSSILNVSNTEMGAATAADVWVRRFEVPADVDNASTKRQAAAKQFFAKVVNQSSSTSQKTVIQRMTT